MIYIKYIAPDNPSQWSIWAHKQGDKKETNILDYTGDTYPYIIPLHLKQQQKYWKIEYITEAEVDLLKLEFL